MNKLELGLNSADTVFGFFSIRHLLDDFDSEIIVGITLETFVTVRRHFILPVGLSDGRSNVMRVETAIGSHVVELDSITVLDIGRWVDGIPSKRSIDWLTINIQRLRHVFQKPDVVLILVGIKCDLLLLASSGIHEVVRMQVPSLGVVVTDADSATECNIDWNILHSFGVECSLELRAHKSISIARVNKAEEVDTEHGHVESQWYDNKAEDSGHQVLGKKTLY